MEANNVVRIPTSLNGNFFRYWFQFLEPFHNLTHREIDVASEFLKYRWELSKVIKDEDLLDKIVMNSDTKKQIRERCNLTLQHFQIILGKLRKSKIIIDDKLNPRFIPKNPGTNAAHIRQIVITVKFFIVVFKLLLISDEYVVC